MKMKEFIIKVDLTHFFKDERKRSLFLVDPNWNEVSDLAKRIETIFDLKDIRFLTEDGCYVPLEEPIRVVATEKTLKAFVLELNSSGSKTENKVKKRKFFSMDDVEICSTPYEETKSKRSKSEKTLLSNKHEAVAQIDLNHNNKENVEKVANLPGDCMKVNNIESSPEKICFLKPSKKNTSVIHKSSANLLHDTSTRGDETNSSSSSSKSKSKTKKNKTFSLVNGTIINEEIPNVTAGKESQSSHIHFDEVEEDAQLNNNDENAEQQNSTIQDYDRNITANDYSTNTLVRETPTKIIFRCALMQMPNTKPRTFDLRPKTNVCNVEILEDIRILPMNRTLLSSSASVVVNATINSLENSKMSLSTNHQEYSKCEQSDDVSSVIILDDTKIEDENHSVINDASEMHTSQLINAKCGGGDDEMELMLSKSKPLESLPSMGDILLFKIIDKGILSGYIVANCEYINRRSKLVTVSLINYPSGSEGLLNRFSANIDGSSSNIEKIILKFSEMIDLKVVNMNQ